MFDIVIFGATGQMGRSITREAVVALKNTRWALAGRCQVIFMTYYPFAITESIISSSVDH